MTPAEFKRRMDAIVRNRDDREVMRQGCALVRDALGSGADAFIPGMYRLFERVGVPSPTLGDIPTPRPIAKATKAKKK